MNLSTFQVQWVEFLGSGSSVTRLLITVYINSVLGILTAD